MKFKKISWLILFYFSFITSVYSTNLFSTEYKISKNPILKKSLSKTIDNNLDTLKINSIIQLAWDIAPNNYKKSIQYSDSAISLSQKIKWLKGEGEALSIKGEALRYGGLLKESLENYKKALRIFKKLDKKKKIANIYSNIGITYFNLSAFPKAMENFNTALKLHDEINDREGIINNYGYIGIVLSKLKEYDKALTYFNLALEKALQLKNKSIIATQYGNIGLTYMEQRKYDKALTDYQEAIKIFEAIEDYYNYSIYLGNIGLVYLKKKDYSKAFSYFEKALRLAQENNDQYGIAHQYGNIGELDLRKVKDSNAALDKADKDIVLKKSIYYLKKAVDIFKNIEVKEEQKNYQFLLSMAYEEKGNYSLALKTFKAAQAIKDTIHSNKNRKIIANLEIKQQLFMKEKEVEILNIDRKHEASIRNMLIVFAGFFVLVSLVILYMYSNKKKRNKRLQENIRIRKKVEKDLRSKKIELEIYQQHLEQLVMERTKELEEEVNIRKETEKKLIIAKDKAEAASKAKSVFLANMSHELRTPLTGILGYSDLLKSMLEDEELIDMAAGINRTGKRLLNTVSLVLDLSRIESDKSEINFLPIDIIKELKEVYQNFKGATSVKKVDFILNLHTDSFIINIDNTMLKVILDNLINNAIKFTKKGSITIDTGIELIKNNTYFWFRVKDTGIGIKEDQLHLVFEEFKQLSEGFTKDFQGSGLGLSITKKYVDLLYGKIKVESTFGKGTAFTIYFPTKIQAAA